MAHMQPPVWISLFPFCILNVRLASGGEGAALEKKTGQNSPLASLQISSKNPCNHVFASKELSVIKPQTGPQEAGSVPLLLMV